MEKKPTHSYKELIVWQKSMDLVEEVYKLSHGFPSSEKFGLTSQIRRSAVTIPSNIAEGRHRRTRKDYLQFLIIAYSSGAELETQLDIALRLKYCNLSEAQIVQDLLLEVMKMLNVMTNKLKTQTLVT